MKRSIVLFILLGLLSFLAAVPRDMVIVEIGTGAWCQFCPGAAMGADDLVENQHRAAIIENHNGDPYATTESNARNSYYGITGYPTAWFDGLNPSVGGNHTTSLYPGYRTKVNARLAIPSNYTITATGTHIGQVYNIAVTVTQMELDAQTNFRLHGVMTESGIQYVWQGQTHLEFVERLMAPDVNGTALDFSTNATQTVNLTFTANSAWNADEFEFIFFLQNNTSKEILQGCKYNIHALENEYPLSVQSINFGTVSLEDVSLQSFTLSNWWTQDMNIDINVDSQDYFIYPQMRDAYMLPFMTDMTFDVMLLPSQAGLNTATVTITTDNPAYPTLTIPLTADVTSVGTEDSNLSPTAGKIVSIAPNPFTSSTSISYRMKTTERAELSIYNIRGARVYSSTLNTQNQVENSIAWNGRDTSGKLCPAGIYFSILKVGGKTVSTRKMIKLN